MASTFSKRIVEEVNSNKSISVNDQTEAIDLAIKAMVDIFAYMHSKMVTVKSSRISSTTSERFVKVAAAVLCLHAHKKW